MVVVSSPSRDPVSSCKLVASPPWPWLVGFRLAQV